jgi:hypothetical protein
MPLTQDAALQVTELAAIRTWKLWRRRGRVVGRRMMTCFTRFTYLLHLRKGAAKSASPPPLPLRGGGGEAKHPWGV